MNYKVHDKELYNKLKAAGKGAVDKLKLVISKSSILGATHIRQKYFTQYSGHSQPNKLQVRSGRLHSSIRGKKPRVYRDKISGGIQLGTRYAATHFGPKGKVKTIRPKNKQYLTIPLKEAMTARGVVRGSARSGRFANTFIQRSGAGNLIIFGQATKRGGITPLFVLKREVKVKTRIHPKDIFDHIKPRMKKDLQKELAGG